MKKQRERKDYWNEYKDYNLESSSDKSDYDEPSPDLPHSDKEKEEVTKNDRKEEGIYESSRYDKGEIFLKIKEPIFKPA